MEFSKLNPVKVEEMQSSTDFITQLGSEDFLVQLKKVKLHNKLLIDKYLFMVINSAPFIYDRGKLFYVLKGYFSLAETYKIGFDTTTFCELVLLGSILKNNYKEERVYKLVLKHGSQVNWLVATWIIFVFMVITNVESKKWSAALSESNRLLFFLLARVLRSKRTHKWYFQLLGRKRAGICLLQLTYELPEVIAVQFLRLKHVVESTKDDIPVAEFSCQPIRVLNSVSDHKFSCCIPLWSFNCGVKDIKILTAAKVPYGESLMTTVARQEGDLLTSHTCESFLIPENTLMADWCVCPTTSQDIKKSIHTHIQQGGPELEIIANCELTTKSLPPDHFWTQELFAELVGSIVGILSGGADDILRITLTFYNARKISVGKFLEGVPLCTPENVSGTPCVSYDDQANVVTYDVQSKYMLQKWHRNKGEIAFAKSF
ncbi:uncharacterized protein LOC113345880 [Papaver somniferum]|uniref:uncharacterized protein LOC113345880 n=1 Tax=Papaver somniferum TaxID=3469 RepID=UPI000E7007E0|nr:uncharacterized protein LOC113345880 [Papaver somniferum]